MTEKFGTYRKVRSPEKIIFSTKSIGGMEKLFENKKWNVSIRTVEARGAGISMCKRCGRITRIQET